MKWIEVDIGLRHNISVMHSTLLSLVKKYVEEKGSSLASWHFLWEDIPWPRDKGSGITLRWRLHVDEELFLTWKDELDLKLKELESVRSAEYLGHCFASHGVCGQEYVGEAEDWGQDGWNFGIKILQLGSEIAMKMVEDKSQIGYTQQYRRQLPFYLDRYTHLFLNQVSTLLEEYGLTESDFYLQEGVQRMNLPTEDKDQLLEHILQFDNVIKGRDIAKEKPQDFINGLIDLAISLQNELGSIGHQDPNLNLMASISVLCLAWVCSIGKAKILALPEERPQLTDEQRRQMSAYFGQLYKYFLVFYRLGLDSAENLRERRGQKSYLNWEMV